MQQEHNLISRQCIPLRTTYCAIRHIGTSFSSWISYLYLMSRTSSVCTDLNQDVGTHICVCLKHRLLVMIWVVKLIEIGCWYSGQPRPLIANPLMPSEKQMTKVTIKQLGRVVKLKQCPLYWLGVSLAYCYIISLGKHKKVL